MYSRKLTQRRKEHKEILANFASLHELCVHRGGLPLCKLLKITAKGEELSIAQRYHFP